VFETRCIGLFQDLRNDSAAIGVTRWPNALSTMTIRPITADRPIHKSTTNGLLQYRFRRRPIVVSRMEPHRFLYAIRGITYVFAIHILVEHLMSAAFVDAGERYMIFYVFVFGTAIFVKCTYNRTYRPTYTQRFLQPFPAPHTTSSSSSSSGASLTGHSRLHELTPLGTLQACI